MQIKKYETKDRYGNSKSFEFFEGSADMDVPSMTSMPNHPGEPRGTDTVPAWLTPGEMVINKEATDMYGEELTAINNEGRAIQDGEAMYAADGDIVPDKAMSQWEIYQYILSLGFEENAARGIMSNIRHEVGSGFDSTRVQKTKEGDPVRYGGMGLFQWEKGNLKRRIKNKDTGVLELKPKGGRFDTDYNNLLKFAKQKNRNWTDPQTQLDFMNHEMRPQPDDVAADKWRTWAALRKAMNNAATPGEAAQMFAKKYEGHAGDPQVARTTWADNDENFFDPNMYTSSGDVDSNDLLQETYEELGGVPRRNPTYKEAGGLIPQYYGAGDRVRDYYRDGVPPSGSAGTMSTGSTWDLLTAAKAEEQEELERKRKLFSAGKLDDIIESSLVEDNVPEAIKELVVPPANSRYEGDELRDYYRDGISMPGSADTMSSDSTWDQRTAEEKDMAEWREGMLARVKELKRYDDIRKYAGVNEVATDLTEDSQDAMPPMLSSPPKIKVEELPDYVVGEEGGLGWAPTAIKEAASISPMHENLIKLGLLQPTAEQVKTAAQIAEDNTGDYFGPGIPDIYDGNKKLDTSQDYLVEKTYDLISNAVGGKTWDASRSDASKTNQSKREADAAVAKVATIEKNIAEFKLKRDSLAQRKAEALTRNRPEEYARLSKEHGNMVRAIASAEEELLKATTNSNIKTENIIVKEKEASISINNKQTEKLLQQYNDALLIAKQSGNEDDIKIITNKINTLKDQIGSTLSDATIVSNKPVVTTSLNKETVTTGEVSIALAQLQQNALGTANADAVVLTPELKNKLDEGNGEVPPKTLIDKASGMLKKVFGKLVDGDELARMAILYAGSRLAGSSHEGSLAWSAKGYLDRVDTKAADHKAQVKKYIEDGDYTIKTIKLFDKTKDFGVLLRRGVPVETTGKTQMLYSPQLGKFGKGRRQSYEHKRGDNTYWSWDQAGQDPVSYSANGITWSKDDANKVYGTDAHKKAMADARSVITPIMEELRNTLDKNPLSKANREKGAKETYITGLGGANFETDIVIRWANRNGVSSNELPPLLKQAYEIAVQSSQAGGKKIGDLTPILNELRIADQLGVPEAFKYEDKGGVLRYMDPESLQGLTNRIDRSMNGGMLISQRPTEDIYGTQQARSTITATYKALQQVWMDKSNGFDSMEYNTAVASAKKEGTAMPNRIDFTSAGDGKAFKTLWTKRAKGKKVSGFFEWASSQTDY